MEPVERFDRAAAAVSAVVSNLTGDRLDLPRRRAGPPGPEATPGPPGASPWMAAPWQVRASAGSCRSWPTRPGGPTLNRQTR